jgi:hypothetical protein
MQPKKCVVFAGLIFLFQAFLPSFAVKPTVKFSALPTTIFIGSSSTLTWTSTNATSTSINQGIGTVPINGSLNVSPTATITYTITVKNAAGTKATATAKVTVKPALPVVTFSAVPNSIQQGQSSTLTWTATNASSVSINNNIGSVALIGSMIVMPSQTIIYILTATGSGGTVTSQVQVIITPAPTVTLTANPQIIQPGEITTLSWTSTNATSAILDNDIGAVEMNGSLTLSPNVTSTYTIAVSGSGGTKTASATVIVTSGKKCYAYIPDATDKNIRIIDTDTYTVYKTIPVTGSLTSLQGVATEPSRVFNYVADTGTTKILRIDPLTMNVNEELSQTGSFQGKPKHMAVAPDGRHIYTTSSVPMWEGNSGKYVGDICTINASGDNLTALRLVFTELPHQVSLADLVVSKDNSRLFVADPDNNQILVLDTSKLQLPALNPVALGNELVAIIPLSAPPLELAFSPNGQTLYAAADSTLFALNALNFTISGSLAVPSGSRFLKVHPDGSKVYVMTQNYLTAAETVGLTKLTTVSISGLYYCSGFDIHPDGSRFFMTDNTYDKLFTVNTANYQVLSTLALGSNPTAIGDFLNYLPITITGNVKQNEAGLSGVAMTLNGEGILHTKQTAAAGDFIFGLKAGNYQLTPTLSNLAFSPESMNLQVSENKTGLDFIVSGIVPLPTVTLASSSTWVKSYESFTLSWTSTGADYVTISEASANLLPPNGLLTISILSPVTFQAIAYNRGGTASASVKVWVSSTAPPTASISANPASILQGGSSTLTWATTMGSTITIDNGIGTVAANSNRTISPAATTTYTIKVTNSQGYYVTASATVEVVPAPIPTITLTATPEMLIPGRSSTLTWASTNATSVTIDNGIGAVDLSGTRAVSPTTDNVYTAIATGPGGTAMATVLVRMLETHLRSIWNGMKTAMQQGNIILLLGYFSEQTKDRYSQIYSAITDKLPQIAQEMREIEPVYFEEYGAKYRIKRIEVIDGIEYDITYYIYFVQEEDGSWKLLNY